MAAHLRPQTRLVELDADSHSDEDFESTLEAIFQSESIQSW